MRRWLTLVVLSIIVGLLLLAHFPAPVRTCNEAVCGSIVSKCLLTQSCKCDFKKDCSCCKECAFCLSYLYDECCSCVDMCPKPNDTYALNKQSHVEDFDQQVIGLFQALTETEDHQKRWKSFTFPVDFNILLAPKNDIKYHLQASDNCKDGQSCFYSDLNTKGTLTIKVKHLNTFGSSPVLEYVLTRYVNEECKQYLPLCESVEQEVIPLKPNTTTLNCTVAFMSQCMSLAKCRANCQAMGASSLRWFNDGCCECIGEYCINYGINQSRCLRCSADKADDDFDDLSDEEKDFGEDDDFDYNEEMQD